MGKKSKYILGTILLLILGIVGAYAYFEFVFLAEEPESPPTGSAMEETQEGVPQAGVPQKGEYIAHVNGNKFHKRPCDLIVTISEPNRVYFKTIEEAKASGRTPHEKCIPK